MGAEGAVAQGRVPFQVLAGMSITLWLHQGACVLQPAGATLVCGLAAGMGCRRQLYLTLRALLQLQPVFPVKDGLTVD